MSAPLSPRQERGRVAIESAVFAVLLGEEVESRRLLQEAIDAGLIEEVLTGSIGLSAYLATVVAVQAQTDPATYWGEFMRRDIP